MQSDDVADATGHVTLFTLQRPRVVATLQRNETHIQPWRNSHAYNTDLHSSLRLSTRRAFLWAAAQFRKRLSRRMPGAPVWAGFSPENVLRGRKCAEEVLLELLVPTSEILVTMHRDWADHILRGEAIGVHEPHCLRFLCSCSRTYRRRTWERIFTLSGDSSQWQAIMDRIEPECVFPLRT